MGLNTVVWILFNLGRVPMSVDSREQAIDLGKLTGRGESGQEQIPPNASLQPPQHTACHLSKADPTYYFHSSSTQRPPHPLASALPVFAQLIYHVHFLLVVVFMFLWCLFVCFFVYLAAQTLTIWLVSSLSGLTRNMFSSTACTAHTEPGAACSRSCAVDSGWASLARKPTLTLSSTPRKEI